MASLFITGTDTGVGKTVVSVLLARAFRAHGLRVATLKPVETGCAVACEGELLPADGEMLRHVANCEQSVEEVVPYRFSEPAAPNVAARSDGAELDFSDIIAAYSRSSSLGDILIVEGAGGLLVPLTDERTFLDFVTELSLPTLVVVGSRLGAINHAALTFAALHSASVRSLGYVFNECVYTEQERDEYAVAVETNRHEIARSGTRYGIKELAALPYLHSGDILHDPIPEACMSLAEQLQKALLER